MTVPIFANVVMSSIKGHSNGDCPILVIDGVLDNNLILRDNSCFFSIQPGATAE